MKSVYVVYELEANIKNNFKKALDSPVTGGSIIYLVIEIEVRILYRIGVFSKISKTTIKALRYYDEIGLLKPSHIDAESGYRFYTTEQLAKLHNIIALKQIGFSINDILTIISGGNIEEILEQRKAEIEMQLFDAKDQLTRINHYILEMREGIKMNYQAVIKQTPECIVYSKRFIVPNAESYFELVPAIGDEVKLLNPNLKCAVPEYCFIEYHDREYKEYDIDVEYHEAVEDFGVETNTIKFKNLPSIPVTSVMHKGAYNGLKNAYAYVFKWIDENGYAINGNPRESYIDGIWNKQGEEEWLTELQVPVIKL